jgi:hypothetical protein
MTDKTFDNIMTKWQQIVDLPPQDLGPFTGVFKIFSGKLKVMPWTLFLMGSFLLVMLLFFFFGPQIIYIVETLQRGF